MIAQDAVEFSSKPLDCASASMILDVRSQLDRDAPQRIEGMCE
jgi:hypothetical protein